MKKNVLKRVSALGLSLLMTAGAVGCSKSGSSKNEAVDIDAVDKKPTEITAMVDTTMTFENGLQDVADKYKEYTGINLKIEKPDHAKYYEKVTLSFASENPSDIIEVGSTYYPQLANYGAFEDLTALWDNSELKQKGVLDENYVNALKINGKLYGFPMAAGNGTCTYVRQSWIDDILKENPNFFGGASTPQNYEQYIEMLRKFKKRPAVDGKAMIPLTAAGLIQSETPYDIYLREFYQDAKPDFYYDVASGKYVDGFDSEAMFGANGALARLREAYQEGLIDAEVVTNKTSTCRDKFGQGIVGCFNYWAGMWCKKLNKSLPEDQRGDAVAIPAIAECKYTERVPTALAMSIFCDQKAATFKWFLCYSHDAGTMSEGQEDGGQMLFTHGVKDIHWEWVDKAANVAHPLKQKENPDTDVEKTFFAPELSITNWVDPIAQEEQVVDSQAIYRASCEFAEVPIVTDIISQNLSDLNDLKSQIIADVVKNNKDYKSTEEALEAGRKQYQEAGKYYADQIVEDLNSDPERLAAAKASHAQ